MKRLSTLVFGVSLLTSSVLYAAGDHKGDHMHEGKMQNHSNENGKTTSEMQNNMKQMNHGNMNMPTKDKAHGDMKPYHHSMMTDGYKTMLSSVKPLKDGKNNMTIVIMKNGHAVKNADVNIKFSMPSMPGMDFTEAAKGQGNKYNTNINFSMGGHWAYELMFKTSDGHMHKTKGSVNIK